MSSRPPRPPLLPPDLLSERAASRLGTWLYVLALAVLAFYDLGGRSIFHKDMPRFATIAREMIRSGDWLVPTQHGAVYANKPILYIWLVAFGSLVPGDPTALTLRIPSALAFLGTGLATAMWGRARSGSVAVGRLAGLLVVTTFSIHELGRVGRPDMLSTCFATITAALVDRSLLGGGGRRPWVLIGLALGGGLLSKGPVVLLIPAALVLLPRAGTTLRSRLQRTRIDAAFALALVVSAAWLVPAGLHGGMGYVKKLVFDQVADRVKGEANHAEALWYYLGAFPFNWLPWSPAFAAAAVASITKRGRAALGGIEHVWAALLALAVLSAVPTKEIRYAAILVPPLAVAAAQWAAWIAARARDDDAPSPRRSHLSIGGVTAILLALGTVAAIVRWPSTGPWVAAPALVALFAGIGAVRLGRTAIATRAVRGRVIGLAVVVFACSSCAYWVVLGRYLVVHAVTENRAVAAALDPKATSVVVGSSDIEALSPDTFYEGAPNARYARGVDALAPFASVRPLELIALESDRAAIEAKLGVTVPVLTYQRADRRTLLILRLER